MSDSQLNKIKSAVEDQTGTTLGKSIKMLESDDDLRRLLLTTRQKTKLRDAFKSNMSADIKLSKAERSKITQSGNFLGDLLSKLFGPVIKIAAPLLKICYYH